MAHIAASNRVVARNGLGRFIRECELAGERTVDKLIEDGAKMSSEMAPRGSKPDPRTVPLHASLRTKKYSRTSGAWYSIARHALPIEKSAGPHFISAYVSFFWDKMGRDWMSPPMYKAVTGYDGADPIHHPGNAAQPFLRPAYEIVMREAMRVARAEYPG